VTVAAAAVKAHTADVKSTKKVVKVEKVAAVHKVTHAAAKKVTQDKPECEVKCPVAKPHAAADPTAPAEKCKPAAADDDEAKDDKKAAKSLG